MTPTLLFLVGFPITGLTVFTLAIITTDLRQFIRREAREVNRLFGHAHRIYPPAPLMQVRPAARPTISTAPLSLCLWRESA
jgi:hypothetical protein